MLLSLTLKERGREGERKGGREGEREKERETQNAKERDAVYRSTRAFCLDALPLFLTPQPLALCLALLFLPLLFHDITIGATEIHERLGCCLLPLHDSLA